MNSIICYLVFVLNVLSSCRTEPETPQEKKGLMEKLLQRNAEWAAKEQHDFPDLLSSLDEKQTPKILWIGCSDSRVPESRIFEAEPGEFFVHRNIGNVIREDDLNLNSVVEYAVAHLNVEHIIICGHYHCGGVQAAMGKLDKSFVSRWIQPVKKVFEDHSKDLVGQDEEAAWRSMVKYNVHQSAKVMAELPAVKEVQSKPNANLTIHPWVYDIKTGLVDIMEDSSVHLGKGSWVTPKSDEVPSKKEIVQGSSKDMKQGSWVTPASKEVPSA